MGKHDVTTALVFVRHGSFGRIDTLAVYEVAHTTKLSTQDQVLAALRRGITAWVKNTDEGKKAWKYSGRDMNIGDVGSELSHSLLEYLAGEGIYEIKDICQVGEPETVPYDTVLVNSNDLEDDDAE